MQLSLLDQTAAGASRVRSVVSWPAFTRFESGTSSKKLAGYESEEEDRDLHHQDMFMNEGRNHHFGPPFTQEG